METPIDKLDNMLTDAGIPHLKKQHLYIEMGIDHSAFVSDPLEGPKGDKCMDFVTLNPTGMVLNFIEENW